MLYGETGALNGDALRLFMTQQLSQAGRILSDQELTLLANVLDAMKKAQEADDPSLAAKAILAAKKLGPLDKLNSFSKMANEAGNLMKKLTEQGLARVEKIKEKLAGDAPPFEAVVELVEMERIYAFLPEVKAAVVAVARDLKKKKSINEMIEQAVAIDRAKAFLAVPHGKTRAIGALKQLAARYPDSPAAKMAEKLLSEQGETAVAANDAAKASPKTGPATSGEKPSGSPASVDKKATAYLKMARTFAEKRPEKAKEYAQKVIDLAPDSEQAKEAKKLMDSLE
jgi:tetratricopeptide (TPR) repeat protein